jgi:pimeloyl-ACP methyl ester carboxylesterase
MSMKTIVFCMALVLGNMAPGHLTGNGAVAVPVKVSGPGTGNIEHIRAYTDLCWYGQKLTRVEITYQEGTDLSKAGTDTYILLDRGYAHPDFARVTIGTVEVNGQTVTLHITTDTEALEDNALIYSGDNATGSRTKNPMGLYATGPWYRAVDGSIHFGQKDSAMYKANTSRDGYQTRPCLELKLYHKGESVEDAACLANADGTYNEKGLWLPTLDANYGAGGFRTFEELGIRVPTTATDGDRFVSGWAYFPTNFDPGSTGKYPLIITITGFGTSYWKHEDGTNNFGTGLNFDGSGFRWMDCGAIVLNIHDRSHTGGEDYKFYVDDYNVIQYFIANYQADPQNITLTGNSRGTVACNTIAATYPGLIKTLILNNGSMGTGIAGKEMFSGAWSAGEWETAARNGLHIWAFDGEQDTDNIDNYRSAVSCYKSAGWPDQWIADNIRLTGFPTQLYYYWGETDHSTTKMTYWYFFDAPYYGPDAIIQAGKLVYQSRLKKGDAYQLKGRLVEGKYNKAGKDYTIYGESLKDWVLSREYQTR